MRNGSEATAMSATPMQIKTRRCFLATSKYYYKLAFRVLFESHVATKYFSRKGAKKTLWKRVELCAFAWNIFSA